MSEDDRAGTTPQQAPPPCRAMCRRAGLADTVRQLASATDDAEGFQGAWNAMRLVGRNIDHQQILNAMHVPEDAGQHGADRDALARIPDGWDAGLRA